MNWQELSRRFANYLIASDRVRGHESNGRVDGHCPRPSHDDSSPSFSYYIESAGWKCSCGKGRASDLIKELGLQIEGGLDVDRIEPHLVAEYDYLDESGQKLYQVQRFIPKNFSQRSWAGDRWMEGKGSMQGVRRVPYRLPEILAADKASRILIVDGEKDVDAAWKLGFPATCHVGGMANWRHESAKLLQGRTITIIADKDSNQSGAKDAAKLRDLLKELGIDAPVIELPGAKVKDLSDWIAHGGTLRELADLAERRESWQDVARAPIVEMRSLAHLVDAKIEYLIEPIVPRGTLIVIQGPPKGGKSVFALYTGICAAAGKWVAGGFEIKKPIKTLLIEFEDADILVLQRAARYLRGLGRDEKDIPENLLFCDYPDLFLDSERYKDALVSMIREKGIELVMIDTFSYVHRAKDENSSSDMKPVMANLKRVVKETGASIFLIHHTGKGSSDKAVSEKGRGSSVISAAPDVILDWGDRKKTNITPVSFLSKYDDGFEFKVEYQPMPDRAVEWQILVEGAEQQSQGETRDQINGKLKIQKDEILAMIREETLKSPTGFPKKEFIETRCKHINEKKVYRIIKKLEEADLVSTSARGGGHKHLMRAIYPTIVPNEND